MQNKVDDPNSGSSTFSSLNCFTSFQLKYLPSTLQNPSLWSTTFNGRDKQKSTASAIIPKQAPTLPIKKSFSPSNLVTKYTIVIKIPSTISITRKHPTFILRSCFLVSPNTIVSICLIF